MNFWSDIIGLLAGFFLMLPPAKDNVYRFMEARKRRAETGAAFPGLAKIIAEVWHERREAFSSFDMLCFLLGGLGLVISFALKLAGG